MSDRLPLSKRVRFGIFKRDEFTCQYCGRKPPAVVLEVDHVVAVADGGTNDEHNLISSCFDCNRGKGAESLRATAQVDIAGKAALLRERLDQVAAYEALLAERRRLEEIMIDDVVAVYEAAFKGWTLPDRLRPSIRQFLHLLPKTEVIEAMEIAGSRVDSNRAFKYFCGVCWRKINGPT